MTTSKSNGWVQINNTVVPYLRRFLPNYLTVLLVPLPVIQYGAGLFIEEHVHMHVYLATEPECKALNKACTEAKLAFSFEGKIELVALNDIVKRCPKKVSASFLPENDPFSSAKYHPERSQEFDTSDKSLKKHDSTAVLDLSKKTNSLNMVIDKIIERKLVKETTDDGESVSPLDLTSKKDELTGSDNDEVELVSYLAPFRRQNPTGFTTKGVIKVCPVKLHGRTVPCIVKTNVQYILVETIRRAFFHHCTFRAFIFMVQRCVKNYIYDLSADDISAIMTFAKNPTCLMRCPKVITIQDADQLIPMIRNFLLKVQEYRRKNHIRKRLNQEKNDVDEKSQSAFKRSRVSMVNGSESEIHSNIVATTKKKKVPTATLR